MIRIVTQDDVIADLQKLIELVKNSPPPTSFKYEHVIDHTGFGAMHDGPDGVNVHLRWCE